MLLNHTVSVKSQLIAFNINLKYNTYSRNCR